MLPTVVAQDQGLTDREYKSMDPLPQGGTILRCHSQDHNEIGKIDFSETMSFPALTSSLTSLQIPPGNTTSINHLHETDALKKPDLVPEGKAKFTSALNSLNNRFNIPHRSCWPGRVGSTRRIYSSILKMQLKCQLKMISINRRYYPSQ